MDTKTVIRLIQDKVTEFIGQVEIAAKEDPQTLRRRTTPASLGGKVVNVYTIDSDLMVTFDDGTGQAQAHLGPEHSGDTRPEVGSVYVFEGRLDFFRDRETDSIRISILPYAVRCVQEKAVEAVATPF